MFRERMEASLMYWSKMKVMESGIEQKNNLYIQIPILCYYFSYIYCVGNILLMKWNYCITHHRYHTVTNITNGFNISHTSVTQQYY